MVGYATRHDIPLKSPRLLATYEPARSNFNFLNTNISSFTANSSGMEMRKDILSSMGTMRRQKSISDMHCNGKKSALNTGSVAKKGKHSCVEVACLDALRHNVLNLFGC
jgi:hypothetical protein